jgi:hypothetical protein
MTGIRYVRRISSAVSLPSSVPRDECPTARDQHGFLEKSEGFLAGREIAFTRYPWFSRFWAISRATMTSSSTMRIDAFEYGTDMRVPYLPVIFMSMVLAIWSRGRMRSTAFRFTASWGIPYTTQLFSSWAMLKEPASFSQPYPAIHRLPFRYMMMPMAFFPA